MSEALNRWQALHAQTDFEPTYPTDSVIRWTFRHFPRGGTARLLDVGAGHGRHALFWASHGHHAFAVDAASQAMSACAAKARSAGLAVECRVAGAGSLPFPDEGFDGLLSFGVLYYLPWSEWQAAFDEAKRVLRVGGRGLFVVRSTQDSRCVMGEPLDAHTWRITAPPDCPWKAEAGLPMTFVDDQELKELAAGFAGFQLDRMRWSDRGGRYWNDDWLVQLTR
jgi:SAM-dependent methyltransferase